MIGNIQEPTELFAEEVPLEEVNSNSEEGNIKIINVFHFTKEAHRVHGVPFRFIVKKDEPFSETKKRLQARVGASDKDFAKYRFALCISSSYKQPAYLEEADEL